MVTRKKIVIPIFEYDIIIMIFDDWDEVKKYFDNEPPAKGITDDYGGRSVVAVGSQFPATLVHESGHLTNAVWRFIGYTPMRDNDEVNSYLQTYIYKKLYEVFEKHWKLKT